MSKEFNAIHKMNNLYIWIYIIIIYTILLIISNEFIITEDIIISEYDEKLTSDQINRILSFRESFGWISYLLQIVLFTLKVFFVSVCLSIGMLFADIKLDFKKIIKVVLISEIIYIIYTCIRLIMLGIKDFNSLKQIQYFFPGSLLSFFNPEQLSKVFVYPLQVINIPQILYFFALAFGLTVILKNRYLTNLKIVISSYGTGLALWIAIVVFAQLYLING